MMKMYSKDGIEMMEIAALEKVGSDLIVRGRILQSMPATLYVRPEEVWEAMRLMSWGVAISLLSSILKGFWRSARRLQMKTR